jgi:deaminated glutathione amidase
MGDALDQLGAGQDLVLLPEYANAPGIEDRDEVRTFACGDGAVFLRALAGQAKSMKSWVVVGTVVEDEGRWVNRATVFDRSGGVWYGYDKVHLTEYESEDLGLGAGDVVGVTGLEGATVGFATCFDVYFPAYFSALAQQKVDMILSPSYQRSESAERLRSMSQVRAIDCDSWFVRSSYAIEGRDTGGRSMIVAPDGDVVADAGREPGVISATIDPLRKFVKPRSHGQPDVEHGELMVQHGRTDIYGNATDNASRC